MSDDQSHKYSDNPDPQSDTAVVNWGALVEGIRHGDAGSMEQLYGMFGRGLRWFFYRQLGKQDIEDKIHDVFVVVVAAIRRGELREPERLMGFVKTVASRRVAGEIEKLSFARKRGALLDDNLPVLDRSDTPEDLVAEKSRKDFMQRILAGLSAREREILTRFYIEEQPQEKICAEMNLTDTQFRLLKSRSKAKFGDMGRRRLESKPNGLLARSLGFFRH